MWVKLYFLSSFWNKITKHNKNYFFKVKIAVK